MRIKCNCICHSGGATHIQKCCDNGYKYIGPILRLSFVILNNVHSISINYPIQQRIDYYKKQAEQEFGREIFKHIEWEDIPIKTKHIDATEHFAEIAVFTGEEIREIVKSLEEIKASTCIQDIDKVLKMLRP